MMSLSSRCRFSALLAVAVFVMGAACSPAGSVSLSWDFPTERSDGTPLTDLAGCRVHYGIASGDYVVSEDAGATNCATISGLQEDCTYYFAVTAYDVAGMESPYSEEATVTVPKANRAPRLLACEDQAVVIGSVCRFQVCAVDADGQVPDLSAPIRPAGAVFTDKEDGSGEFVWKPGISDIGDHEVRFVASDGGTSDTNVVSIHVSSFFMAGPANGEIVRPGAALDISWQGQWSLGAVVIDLWQGTNLVATFGNEVAAASNSVVWTASLPAGLAPGPDYFVSIIDLDNLDDYAVSELFTVRARSGNDFDGDGRSDLGCYYAPGGNWYIAQKSSGLRETTFGYAGTVPVSGDFDGDGISDFGCYYAPGGNWYIYKSTEGFYTTTFGYAGTIPIVGDFDGDGKDDFGCYYAPGGNWYIYRSTDGFYETTFGYAGTVPIVGDFDGDGKDDFGCYYAPGGNWYIYKSTDGFYETTFGYAGTVPIVGDFDGDGKDDFGCYYAPGGNWYIYRSTAGFYSTTFGYAGTIPIIGDYDGDGQDDFGCYYAPGGNWYIYKSTEGFYTTAFGHEGTLPLGMTLTAP